MQTRGRVLGRNRRRYQRATVKEREQPLWLWIGTILVSFSVLCGTLFALRFGYFVFLLAAAAVMTPVLCRIVKRQRLQYQRFCDANSYMQSFISGMLLHQRIVAALEDVLAIFPEGQMHDCLIEMQTIMQNSCDVQRAQKEAFSYLERQYPNSQMGMIHEFAMRVERRGGTFEVEMKLLDDKRRKWEKRIEHCQNTMKVTACSSVFLYAAMIFICAMVQRMMPEELSVIALPLSQVSECILVAFFYLFIAIVIAHLSDGWLTQENTFMNQKVKGLLDYVENGNAASSINPLRRFVYYMRKQRVKKELQYAVPRWLFDVCLLSQKYNITVSITESRRTAPEILKKHIQVLLVQLQKAPSSTEPFLNFLSEYQMASITRTMRMLVSIQNGYVGDSRTQMDQLIAHSMNMLDEINRKDVQLRDAWNVRYNIYPMIPAAIVMGGYLISMVIKIFKMMTYML